MPVMIKVKSENDAVKTQREAVARGVLTYFGDSLPASRILCFLDDDDPSALKGERGTANRGLYRPIHDYDYTRLAKCPRYVTNCIYVDDGVSSLCSRVVDDLIYLYGSTCANEVGLTMTLAHELQHAIQHSKARQLWAVNTLVNKLQRAEIIALGLTWADIPIEREARIVAKRAAVKLLGERAVLEYIDGKIDEHVTDDDVADWQFVRTLTPLSSVDLVSATQVLGQRLKGYKSEVEKMLQETRRANPRDFNDVDLDAFLNC